MQNQPQKKYSKKEREKAIDYLLLYPVICSHSIKNSGDVVKNLPESMREVLKDCTAEDFQHRVQGMIGSPKFEKLLREFDKKLKK